ncbi:hypothetical protein AXF42_Ash000415 [Apostasia shenzhenica]|uniref:Uncharacterized protein n=1 Tax=Apostasia shenzhenica TaxID=1088818 RepID=A0A2I0AGA6_9ASPA|nr:hypothetical protein AXF42_Ash000415 [Apostasia shenzhenica]
MDKACKWLQAPFDDDLAPGIHGERCAGIISISTFVHPESDCFSFPFSFAPLTFSFDGFSGPGEASALLLLAEHLLPSRPHRPESQSHHASSAFIIFGSSSSSSSFTQSHKLYMGAQNQSCLISLDVDLCLGHVRTLATACPTRLVRIELEPEIRSQSIFHLLIFSHCPTLVVVAEIPLGDEKPSLPTIPEERISQLEDGVPLRSSLCPTLIGQGNGYISDYLMANYNYILAFSTLSF